jgi:putative thioredoxin
LQARKIYQQTKDAASALTLLTRAVDWDPKNERAIIDSATFMVDLEKFEDAKRLLATLSPLTQMDESVSALRARMDFAASAATAPDAESLKQRIARDPADLDARLLLANLCVASEDYATALDQLLEIVRRDRAFRDDIARKTMLQVFSVLGNEGDLVSEYRRRLASAMY